MFGVVGGGLVEVTVVLLVCFRDFSQTDKSAFPWVDDARRRTGQMVVASKVSLSWRIWAVADWVVWFCERGMR